MAKDALIKTAKFAAIPAGIVTYITVSGLTGFCPTCEVIVDSVRGGGSSGSCSLPHHSDDTAPVMVSAEPVTNIALLPISTMDGETVTVGSLEGYDPSRPTVVDVWATYCPPCRQLRTTLHGMDLSEVNVIAVAADRPEQLEAFISEKPTIGHEVVATRETLEALGGVTSVPLLVFASSDGEIRERLTGAQPADAIASVLADLD